MNEYGSFSKEVAQMLDMNPNTLRRWSIELEKKGYEFERNPKGQRIYYKRDILALSQLQHLVSERMPTDNAFKMVADQHINKREIEQTLSVHDKEERENNVNRDELHKLLLQHIKSQEEFNQELLKRLDAQQKYIDERMNKRDENMMKVLDQTLEAQKQIAATQEENKKGLFAKLFGQKK